MKCPYCNEEMTPGYIQSRDGVYWNNKERKVAALPPINGIKLSTNGNLFTSSAKAFNCPKCKKIIIDYDGERYFNER